MTAKSRAKQIVVKGMAAWLLTSSAVASQTALPSAVPMPSARPMNVGGGVAIDPARFGGSTPAVRVNPIPAAPAQRQLPADASAFTASISSLGARVSDVKPMRGDLNGGLQALAKGDADKARAIREGMVPGSLDRQILAWAVALNGGSDVPAAEIARAAAELKGWPGMSTLRANSEKALYREAPPPREVVAAFASSQPESPEGAMALARAYLSLGEAGRATALIARTWREERLDKDLERKFLASFATLLTRADHKYRMEKLLYAERVTDAGRAAALAGAESLYKARAAVIRGEGNAGRLLAAVHPSHQGDASFAFARIETLRKAGKIAEAAELLVRAPKDATALIDPDAWWNERRIIARDLLDLRQPKTAYRVASSHSAESQTEAVEAEFHAGWIALRFLNDTRTAHAHFARIAELSSRPLSLSRSYYWLGRTAEAGGPGQARDYYARAARHGTTYYGQLAATKLGGRPGAVIYPQPSNADRQRFESREAVRAIKRLEQIGFESRANILYRELANELESPGELAQLAVMAERRGNHYLSLKVGKQASWRGIDAPALAFPIGVIPASASISAAGKALAYAIARQESEFNPAAKSPAGALGLLQLMPGTAKAVAGKAGLPYSLARLTSDPGYNATLGARFLGEQISDFGGSYILTFVAYNAGPRRAREWIERFGDPRGKSTEEVVDWVERIPFTETRNYVQRVMENYQVYKMRLGADFSIEKDLRFGRSG